MSTQATTDPVEDPNSESRDKLRPRAGGPSARRFVPSVLFPLLLLAGGGAYVSGLLDGLPGLSPSRAEQRTAQSAPSVFYELPELFVDVDANRERQDILKLRVTLQLEGAQSVHRIEAVLPRIVASLQAHLQELRVEDLRGSAGLYRLREELLRRVNAAAEPVEVEDLLLKEILVQ